LPLQVFVGYGRWFQQQVVPKLDSRNVTEIARQNGGFSIRLADGTEETARRVVVATGMSAFARLPSELASLPSELVHHSSTLRDPSAFRGCRVAVIGAGQSAIESAALLHEAGADVELLARAPELRFLGRRPWAHELGPVTHALFHKAEVGPAGLSHLNARPHLYRQLPRRYQDQWAVRSLQPAGSKWLRNRIEAVPVSTSRVVRSAATNGSGVQLDLDDGTTRHVDRVIAATGYHVDVARYPFLTPELVAAVDRVDGSPRLSRGFESSVHGLYFLGAPSAWSFGPYMRFVAGTAFAGPRLARAILGGRRSPPPGGIRE
jgi:cation diffusion facilitator CzcD-associated flavoprotein CzcO